MPFSIIIPCGSVSKSLIMDRNRDAWCAYILAGELHFVR
jgi:hypothetical protein